MARMFPGEWAEQAACKGERLPVFYPEHGESIRAAKRICATCPVTVACLNHALAAGEAFGVWGGLGERERRQLRVGDVASPARLDIRGRTRPRSPFEHGKPGTSGYQRHLREATEPCMPCRQAAAAARALYRQQRGSA